jgi:hypothetical protein
MGKQSRSTLTAMLILVMLGGAILAVLLGIWSSVDKFRGTRE